MFEYGRIKWSLNKLLTDLLLFNLGLKYLSFYVRGTFGIWWAVH